jgi:hypothetical protein
VNLLDVFALFCGISFVYFGISCFTSKYMEGEYIRYGLAQHRILVGFLQILGGMGLLLGWYLSPSLACLASFGLFLLMVMGFGLRIKIRDGFWATLPSLGYAILSGVLFIMFLLLSLGS